MPTASPHYDPNRPKPQEKHLVQLMLYRALFVYEFDKYAGQLRHVMLLYSRYPEGLVSTAQRPELMLRAIRMRNCWHIAKSYMLQRVSGCLTD